MSLLRVGLVQMDVVMSKEENVQKAEEMIKRAKEKGAQLVVLPEMFNCPYQASNFPIYGEKEGGYTWEKLSRAAWRNQVWLVGGSIPEIDHQGKVYNTSYVFDDHGNQVGKHRKMHLFDIDVKGGQYFKESDTLSPGNEICVFDTLWGKMGVMICYDLRFPELARLLTQKGAKVIIVPGAFNMTTGPLHWELLFRTRAVDNQVYMIGVAPARDEQGSYVSYANSIIVDPWGKTVNRLGTSEDVLMENIDFKTVENVRKELPLLQHLRHDIYSLNWKK